MNARVALPHQPRLRFREICLWTLLLVCCTPARASVALLLEQPYGGMGTMNPTGHSALYFDHICAETPVQLRACRPGELGAVLSRYDNINGYDWVAIPLLPYLYAVESPEDVPASVDLVGVSRLRNFYRRSHLLSVAPDGPEGRAHLGNWYELVGSAYDRTIYGFQVNSTPQQDERLIALLNDRKNVERYNLFRNCADFTRVTLNRFYPHAIRRNLIADLGLSTPKSVARSLTRYAVKHPETGLQMFVIPQVKGSLPRSHHVQGVAESLLTRYMVPLTLISPTATGVMFVAYLGHGRFDVPKNAPVLDLSAEADAGLPRNVAPLETRILLASATAHAAAEATAAAVVSSSLPALPGRGEEAPARAEAPMNLEGAGTSSGAATVPVSSSGSAANFTMPALNLPLFK